MVTPEKVIRIVNMFYRSEVSIFHGSRSESNSAIAFLEADYSVGQEITRDEFKKQFEEASRLIVLEE